MTAATVALPARSKRRGGAPARRAILRWAFRMFRRDWRRQALILGLLTAAVAATTVGLAVLTNTAQLRNVPTFGAANTIFSVPGRDPQLAADVRALQQRFGTVDVVGHQRIPVPGSVATIDLRAANPRGPFFAPTIRLDSGRFPTRAGEIAVTKSVASTFDLRMDERWTVGGYGYTVVGTVENPLDLTDAFALVAPGTLASPTNVSVLANAPSRRLGNLRLPSGAGMGVEGRGAVDTAAVAGITLAFATIGMLFVGLLAVAGFAVVAQRRMRALGVLSSIGANDRSVRLVMLANGAAVGLAAAALGGVLGFLIWLGVYQWVQSAVGHRIGPFDLPWIAVVLGLVLAVVTAVLAAWWPARAAARVPVVAALSGRPPRRQPAHRFAAAGVVVLTAGIALLAFSHKDRAGFIIAGTIASVVGLLLLAPLAIQGVARLSARAPISLRLALRDLARYQARSGAALGAATLAIAIAATIAIAASSVETTAAKGSLPGNEMIVYVGGKSVGPGSAVPVLDDSQTAAVEDAVAQMSAALHTNAVALEQPYNPDMPVQAPGQGPGDQTGGRLVASLAHIVRQSHGESIDRGADLYLATPALLARYGIDAKQIGATTEIVTSRTDLRGMSLFDPGRRNQQPTVPSIQILRALPTYGSDPSTLITPYGLRKFGFETLPSGWLLHTSAKLTPAQIDAARRTAASSGLVIETRRAPKSTAPLRNWSTLIGIAVALGVLAMTVGLIRSEAGRDMSTLAATGASTRTRRSITGATTGTLALLGAVLGTAGAYAALVAWFRSDLHPLTHVPWLNLVLIVVGLPVVATAAGWLLSGREPRTTSRAPLE